MDWKKALARLLKDSGLVQENYTGKLILNLNQGNITDGHRVVTAHEGDCKIERTERVK